MNFYIIKKMKKIQKKIFEDTFKENHIYLNGEDGVDKPVDIDEFLDYYESVSLMILEDIVFKEVLLKSWGIIPLDQVLKKEEPQKEETPQKEEAPKKDETPKKRRNPKKRRSPN